MKLNKKKVVIGLLLLILTIPAIYPLLNNGFPLTDDGNWMVIRFSSFYEALKFGQFPVRFLYRLNNSFGYPVADFLYPLFMYLAVPIHALKLSFVDTIKIIFGLSMLGSSIFCFLWLNKKFNSISSLVGAIAYSLFPYHLYDMYFRGSIGEVLVFAIVPFILWQIGRGSFVLTSLGIALLITAHNSLALLFLAVIAGYVVLMQYKNIKKWIWSLVFGLGMSAFFWIPALYDRQFTVFDNILVSDYTNYFITGKNIDLIGFTSITTLIISAYLFFKKRTRQFSYFFILSIVFTLLALPLSKIIWEIFPFTNLIQFPFRLLSIVCLTTAFLISYQLNLIKGKILFFISVIYILIIFLSSVNYIYPKSFQNYPDAYYSTNLDSTTVKNEYMPKWVKNIPVSMPNEKVQVIKGEVEILNLVNKGKISFNAKAGQKSLIQINTVYFPGWIVKVNGVNVPIKYEESGLIQFPVDQGEFSVIVYFTETPVRFGADIISLVFLILLIIFSTNKIKLKFLNFN